MFKKERDLAERSKTLLKNKEVRTLKAEILKKFPQVGEEELNTVIPNKADITVTKLANKTLLYSVSGVTLVFDIESRNNLCPALPFLWRFPQALPTFVIHSPVSEFVLRGADLMVPGICKSRIADLAGAKEGDKVAIRVMGNPLPFAVGECLVSGAALNLGKLKGRAVMVYHVYGDLISTANVVPNAGFGPSRIYAVEGFAETGAQEAQSDTEDDNESDEEEELEEGTGDGDDSVVPVVQDGEAEALADDVAGLVIAEDTESVADDANDSEHEGHDHDEEVPVRLEKEPTSSTTEVVGVVASDVDALLLQAVLLATKYVVKDKQLPMLVSTYWALLQR